MVAPVPHSPERKAPLPVPPLVRGFAPLLAAHAGLLILKPPRRSRGAVPQKCSLFLFSPQARYLPPSTQCAQSKESLTLLQLSPLTCNPKPRAPPSNKFLKPASSLLHCLCIHLLLVPSCPGLHVCSTTSLEFLISQCSLSVPGLRPRVHKQSRRNFFANKVQEDKESKELELSLEQPLFEGSVAPQSSPPSPPLPPKKKGQRGRKEVTPEKPIPPAEPPEPILHGSMAIGAVSLAVAKTCATLTNTPLYSKIASLKYKQESPRTLSLPLLMVTMLSCGKSSSGKLNLMKEVICIPHPGLTVQQGVTMLLEIQKQIIKIIDKPHTPKPETKKGHNGKKGSIQIVGKLSYIGCLSINYDTIEQPLLLLQGICGNLGLELGINLYLAINCAAHELIDYTRGKYEVTTGVFKNPSEMVDIYVDLINKFPSITALIDPVRKEDIEQWGSICNALGSRCNIIAGTASKSVPKLLEEQNVNIPKSSGLIIKHTNQTTISNLIEVTNLIESQKRIAILGSTEGESSDDSLADLAVGLGVRFLKLGGLSRGERMTKYNRLFTIEEELVQSGTLTPTAGQTFIDFSEEDQKAAEAFVTSLSSVSTGRAESDVTRFSIKSEAIK
ncbi:enolase 4 [Sarcophilus harrisii]